jgi:hypothetical protein
MKEGRRGDIPAALFVLALVAGPPGLEHYQDNSRLRHAELSALAW